MVGERNDYKQGSLCTSETRFYNFVCASYIFVRVRRGRKGLEEVNDCFVCESERAGMRAAYT